MDKQINQFAVTPQVDRVICGLHLLLGLVNLSSVTQLKVCDSESSKHKENAGLCHLTCGARGSKTATTTAGEQGSSSTADLFIRGNV